MKFAKKQLNVKLHQAAGQHVGARYECLKCGHVASYTTMLKHEDGQLCTTKQSQAAAAKMGLRQIQGTEDIEAVIAAGVEHKRLPARLLTFVPDWVHLAIKSYRKQGRYANMTLKEFLERCKPE